MFVDALSAAEKEVLVRVLCEVARADQTVSAEERDIITRYGLSLGLNKKDLDVAMATSAMVAADELRALPERTRKVILIEAQTLAMIDGDYAEVEASSVDALAERLGLDAPTRVSIDQYVRRGYEWAKEGAAIVGGEAS